jgi:hypothetical protein
MIVGEHCRSMAESGLCDPGGDAMFGRTVTRAVILCVSEIAAVGCAGRRPEVAKASDSRPAGTIQLLLTSSVDYRRDPGTEDFRFSIGDHMAPLYANDGRRFRAPELQEMFGDLVRRRVAAVDVHLDPHNIDRTNVRQTVRAARAIKTAADAAGYAGPVRILLFVDRRSTDNPLLPFSSE